jgi:autophagy-related protein 11
MFKLLITKLEILYNGQRELEKQAYLLRGLKLDLEAISKIKIQPEFLSQSSEKQWRRERRVGRTLGDYVSNAKMRQVDDMCAKTHSMSPVD